ncbi:hypothetical protein [Rubinisphaera brasiliensis]|uniref:Uncharacterized protein n=1 Tax=Rubinisphaera brasiliensis (strain ATCC 49424 / DSM 5305 / JCM 21570 / IAM 15109 / NBRC 103401 / IFAM 1448) TaxID=756272 RepID=F0SMN3_RUBBR|nr:hypothetical protein [Rubinisphaera brasiliensis]ADY58852.1 hypothetical protein Plabr_1239 [Rubinisphaera brasiliensis DSM 5305]
MAVSIASLICCCIAMPLQQAAHERAVADGMGSSRMLIYRQVDDSPVLSLLAELSQLAGQGIPRWCETPRDVQVFDVRINRDQWTRLAQLDIRRFRADAAEFDAEDLAAFVDGSRHLRSVELTECSEIPDVMLDRLRKDCPALDFQIRGEALPQLATVSTPAGLRIETTSSDLPNFFGARYLVALDGQPLQTYHQVKRKVGAMKPGESVRLTVRDVAGVEREEVFTVPVK